MSNILDKRFEDFDLGNVSIREYFYKLTSTLWEENESFNGKRPFGNSGWGSSLIDFLIEEDLIDEWATGYQINQYIINNILKPLFSVQKEKREILTLTEIEIAAILNWDEVCDNEEYFDENNDLVDGIWNDFETVEENDEYYSLEDSYTDLTIIVRRISDGKFFSGQITRTYCDDTTYEDLTLKEVFPKEKSIIVYE